MDVNWSDDEIYTAIPLNTLMVPENENINETNHQPILPSSENPFKEQSQQQTKQHSENDKLQTKQHSEMPDELSIEQQSDVDQFSETHRSNTEHTSVELQSKVEKSTLQQQFESKQSTERQNKIGKTLEEISDTKQAAMQENNDPQSETYRLEFADVQQKQTQPNSENKQFDLQEFSDDDIPLIQLQHKILREGKRKRKRNAPILVSDDEKADNSDFDTNYNPSHESSSYSDGYQTPATDKRKRKWVRKRIRPLKRKQCMKEGKGPVKLKSNLDYGPKTEEQILQETLQKSKKENELNKTLKRFAETRVTKLLCSNGLERQQIEPDGNCFFSSVIHQIGTEMSVTELRSKLCSHLKENEKHYIGYISRSHAKIEVEISEQYGKMVEELAKDGIWDTEMSDVLPLATANMLRKRITIYSSTLHSPIIHVSPDIEGNYQEDAENIKIAYVAVAGYEHYDSCVRYKKSQKTSNTHSAKLNETEVCNKKQCQSPTKGSCSVSNMCATPRKKADYKSPKKVKRSRKQTPNVQEWKKNIRKTKRNSGQAYISDPSKRSIEAKKVLSATCNNCKNKCAEKISEEVRKQIFTSYWEATMTFERKRDFICQHIDVQATSNRYGRTRKHQARKFYLPVDKQRVKVCKSFFLNTLNIGKKVVECTLQRKKHGSFDGTDKRGRHTPANKTDGNTIHYVKTHIESFPVVESHYTRKLTTRKYLSQDLSIRKMYELYKTKCQEDGKMPVSEKVYRNVFCNEFNLLFHKPKKDLCQICNTFNEKKKTGKVSESDQVIYSEHLKRKEESRIEKENDKKTAKHDKDIFVATFDLQAVLQTPCSNVSQTYYKRKLNSYNLTVYSLADSKGTCYIWNETRGQRGSSEIGTCIMTHLNSLLSNVKHVILYSDCCSGQNRNQYLAAGLLNTVSQNPHIQVIEQKFLESGHTQMECDSMHSAIEHAKKQTSLYAPEQWDTFFQMARRQNPYVVVPLRYNNFYDLKKYAKDNFRNFKTSSEGTKVNWLKMKVLKVQKSHADQIFVKYNFGDNEFVAINVRRAQRGRPGTMDKMPMRYKEKLPISMAKKHDLMDLCKAYIIPEIYWAYYENLPTNKTARDRLTCADILEDESGSDTDDEC